MIEKVGWLYHSSFAGSCIITVIKRVAYGCNNKDLMHLYSYKLYKGLHTVLMDCNTIFIKRQIKYIS